MEYPQALPSGIDINNVLDISEIPTIASPRDNQFVKGFDVEKWDKENDEVREQIRRTRQEFPYSYPTGLHTPHVSYVAQPTPQSLYDTNPTYPDPATIGSAPQYMNYFNQAMIMREQTQMGMVVNRGPVEEKKKRGLKKYFITKEDREAKKHETQKVSNNEATTGTTSP